MSGFSSDSRLRAAARTAVAKRSQGSAKAYVRNNIIPRLLPLAGADLSGPEPATTRVIVAKLAGALRSERARGRAGHWTYDLNRHIALNQAHAAERAHLAEFARTGDGP